MIVFHIISLELDVFSIISEIKSNGDDAIIKFAKNYDNL
ncbi:hypothetical protein LCGC14_1534140 [marine sediment metagenome]|uniref:Uncharacterized protein n=1 Tax=marine sediment metagenome TaxID=412755 RepID=A0A0F9IV46_9ZZZZ